MLKIEQRPHVNGLVQVYVARHPVNGKANWRVGYADPEKRTWSLIVEHRLRESHIMEIDRELQRQWDESAANTGPDSENGGSETNDGEGS